MKSLLVFVNIASLALPASCSLQTVQQVLQSQEHVFQLGTDGASWPTLGDVFKDGKITFDDQCFTSPAVSELLGGGPHGEADCNTAAGIADLANDVCLKDPACSHPFLSSEENEQWKSSKEQRQATRACVMASFLLEPEGVVQGISDPEYKSQVNVNWSKDCWLEARCVVRPTTTEQVSKVMKIINLTSTKFAIRSGGHNPNKGWGGIGNDGILIDLSLLQTIDISPDALTVAIGPGNRWIEVYRQLDGTGRNVLGGRTPDVGVGGLLLGGGIPSFSSQYGFACDLVRRYEVVLANGTITTADRDTNPDLWWALKGGGANFGIVTEFVLETVPVDSIWYEARIYGAGVSRDLIKAAREYQNAAEADDRASFAFSLSNNHTIVAFIYSEPVERPAVFDMFYDIPFERHFIKPSTGTPYTLAAAFEQVLGDRPAFKRDIIAISTKPDLDLYEKSYDKWLETSGEMLSKFPCMMTFGIQPVTSSAIITSQSRGGNPMNANLAPEGQLWYTSVIQWQDDEFDDLAHQAVVRSGGAVRELAAEKGILYDFEFLNDASWHQNPLASYGSDTFDKLLAVSRKYDPFRIFQELQGRGFLLEVTPEGSAEEL